jgi:hypothetical protein
MYLLSTFLIRKPMSVMSQCKEKLSNNNNKKKKKTENLLSGSLESSPPLTQTRQMDPVKREPPRFPIGWAQPIMRWADNR